MQSFFTDAALASHDKLLRSWQGFLPSFCYEESGVPGGRVTSQEVHSEATFGSELEAHTLCLRSAGHLCGAALLPMPARWEVAVRSCHVPLPLTPSSLCAHLTILGCWGRGQPGHGSLTRTAFSDLVSEKLKSDCPGVSGGPPAGSQGKKGNGTNGADASVPVT